MYISPNGDSKTNRKERCKMKIQELKKGDYFTIKPIAEPKESQVFVYDGYDRSERKYCATKFSDISIGRTFKKDTEVYIDFTF
jgi:hypothetical protein